MKYPEFFDTIETISLEDKLSAFLGTLENGIVNFSYLDVVKSAGHSCPTVAGAYISTLTALKALYKDELPKRGEIEVSFKEHAKDNVIGVIANVIAQITGACDEKGFKGINGKFERNGLLSFDVEIKSQIKFTRKDTDKSIGIIYDPSMIKPNPLQNELMQKIIQNRATLEDRQMFGKIWQERVSNIFQNIDKVITIIK